MGDPSRQLCTFDYRAPVPTWELIGGATVTGLRDPKHGWKYVACGNCTAAIWLAPGVPFESIEVPPCRRKAAAN